MAKAKRKPKFAKPAEVEPLVNEWSSRQGDYRREPMPVTEGELGEEKSGNVLVTRNRGGTTVQRWLAAHQLSESQANGIAFYQTVWHQAYSEQRVTANWSLVAFIRGASDDRRFAEIDARETLGLLDDKVFDIAPRYYFDVWQNIVIFDQPAGIAGGSGDKAKERAKTICLFIADVIATVMRL